MKKLVIILVGLLSLSACSLFSPVKSEPATAYLINTVPQPPTKRPHSAINLLVTQPTSDSIYNTTDMAYTTKPFQIGYFVKSTWAETPAQMLQPLIVQTLQKTHYFHSVGSLTTIGQYNYTLNTQLIKLEQDYSSRQPSVRLVLRAQLINNTTGQIIANKEFSASAVILRNDTYDGVVASNRATAQVLRQLAHFCLRAL